MNDLPAELLQEVFLGLESRDLLNMQQVCRHWTSLITNSPTIQQKLFFRAVPQGQTHLVYNSLLRETFPEIFRLDLDYDKLNYYPIDNYPTYSNVEGFRDLLWFTDKKRRDAVLRADASWRRMFLTQPPVKLERIELLELWPCTGHNTRRCAKFSQKFQDLQKEGILMGWLYDLVIQEMDRDYTLESYRFYSLGNSFVIRWPHMMNLQDDESIHTSRDTEKVDCEPPKPENGDSIWLCVSNTVECCGGEKPFEPSGLRSSGVVNGLVDDYHTEYDSLDSD
jgi:hypothetical protein